MCNVEREMIWICKSTQSLHFVIARSETAKQVEWRSNLIEDTASNRHWLSYRLLRQPATRVSSQWREFLSHCEWRNLITVDDCSTFLMSNHRWFGFGIRPASSFSSLRGAKLRSRFRDEAISSWLAIPNKHYPGERQLDCFVNPLRVFPRNDGNLPDYCWLLLVMFNVEREMIWICKSTPSLHFRHCEERNCEAGSETKQSPDDWLFQNKHYPGDRQLDCFVNPLRVFPRNDGNLPDYCWLLLDMCNVEREMIRICNPRKAKSKFPHNKKPGCAPGFLLTIIIAID